MTATCHRLIVVREDGITHSSDFSGWHSEPAVYQYFREATNDKRTLYATVIVRYGPKEDKWSVRNEFVRTGNEK